jgi:hypothetical protein
VADFIQNWVKYAEGVETPELYDIWSALATLSSIVSRRVWINQGYYTIYANIYVVLVGMPGGRKTTSMNMAKDMLRELGDIPFAATAMTKEALTKYMATQCQRKFTLPGTDKEKTYTPCTLCLTELSHFLGTNSAHMIDFLTTIYDQEVYDSKTKNKGDDIIPGPYLTILACTTPSNITRYLKEDVISGGFSRRTLFAFELEDGEPIPFPEVTPEAQKAWEDCVQWGRSLSSVRGEFVWTPAAKKWYEDFYVNLHKSIKEKNDVMTRGYYKSKHIQLLKISMLLALASNTELLLHDEHLQLGLEILNRLEVNMHKVYEGMGRNELNAIAARIVEMLEMSGKPVPEKQVFATFYREADTRELYGIVTHLRDTGRVIKLEEKDPNGNLKGYFLTTPEIGQRLTGVQQSRPPVA